MISLAVETRPLLDLRVFVTSFANPLGTLTTPPEILALWNREAAAPVHSDDKLREEVRKLLRAGGFKPTGRSKPSSEYLLKAVEEQRLTSINLAVDVCNAVSYHSGLPISVVDPDRICEPFRVGIAPAGASYVFNASDQMIDLGGLLCLFDADGPCANGVKDAQRAKTTPETKRTLTLIWGTTAIPNHAEKTRHWYEDLLKRTGAVTEPILINSPV